MSERGSYGRLLDDSAKIHRAYFHEMCTLIGVRVIYRAPLPGKTYTMYSEIESNYAKPVVTGCIFEEHPTQQTLRKIGWVSELQEGSSLIHVDYDLPGIQQGALFVVPSGIDNAQGRLFRVVQLSNGMIYPSSLICEIVPEYEDTVTASTVEDYQHSSFNLLNSEGDNLFRS